MSQPGPDTHPVYASIIMCLSTHKIVRFWWRLSAQFACGCSVVPHRRPVPECERRVLPDQQPASMQAAHPPPTATPTAATAATMKRLLTQPVEEYTVKWLHYGPQPDERWALLPSHQAPAAGLPAWPVHGGLSCSRSTLCSTPVVACTWGSSLPPGHCAAAEHQSGRPPESACRCRMLLLEDPETGDVLTLLVYAQPLFGENYSRKLANKAWSAVPEPPSYWLLNGAKPVPRVWRAAFESSQATKAMVKGCYPQAPRVSKPDPGCPGIHGSAWPCAALQCSGADASAPACWPRELAAVPHRCGRHLHGGHLWQPGEPAACRCMGCHCITPLSRQSSQSINVNHAGA